MIASWLAAVWLALPVRAAAPAGGMPAGTAAAERAAGPFPEVAPDDQVFEPMQAEMNRSFKKLKLDSFGPPYFLAYRVTDVQNLSLAAAYGSMLRRERSESRGVYVEARFGDETFDNTDMNYTGHNGGGAWDPEVLRQDLWTQTDAAYKAALSGFLEKKARKATELDRDKLDDFSREPSYVAAHPSPAFDFEERELAATLRSASAEFRRYPFVYGCEVFAGVRRARRYLLTSEGARIATPYDNTPVRLSMSAWSRADDGMLLEVYRGWNAPQPKDLPSVDELRAEAARLAADLKTLRAAPLQAPQAAPAIIDPEMAGVLFHESLGHKLEGQRQRDPNASQVFRDEVGRRILPAFLDVVDDPTMKDFKGRPLNGHYDFDAEGTPASPVILLSRGVLKGFLMSRWPIKGFPRSNGHGRAGLGNRPTGRMSNLMVVARESVPAAELKKRLLALCKAQGKPYGFRLVGSMGGENPRNRSSVQTLEVRPRLVYRVDAASGEETMVRGVKLVGTPLVVLNRIVAAGDDATLANNFVCGAESGFVPVDQIAPSLLLSEVELQRIPEERARPPLLSSPLHDKP